MSNQTDDLDVHDMIRELTTEHPHREPYAVMVGTTRISQHWTTKVPALVHQLIGATPEGSGEMSGASAASRPAARIEALDTLWLIDFEAGDWIYRLGGVVPGDWMDPHGRPLPGSGTIRRLNRLHGLHPSTEVCKKAHRKTAGVWCCQRGDLEHAVSRWWHQARIITGWDSQAWRPDNTCPVCDVRRSLRINAASQAAFCIECRSVWDSSAIGLLADHIRAENLDELVVAGPATSEDDTRTESCA